MCPAMGQVHCMILPTKTSRLWIHMYSGSENFLSTLSQVTSTSWADDLHLFILIAKQPTPRIKPRFICGHFVGSCGQRYLARSQIRLTGVARQDVMICDIDSVVLHMLHVPLCSWFQMLNHTLPIIWVLCIDLKRNCWTLSLMVHFLMLLHIVSSVSRASR